MSSFNIEPIGVAHTSFAEKADAPRQPRSGHDVEGTVELFPGRGFEQALEDLAAWDHIWLIAWLDRSKGWRAKVEPPRSAGKKRGLFSTRAPYRPNPIGLSAVELLAVEGLVLRVRGIDLLDGTPILDVKPYVPYTDAIPDASPGWLPEAGDARDAWRIEWQDVAREQADWLGARGVRLVDRVELVLRDGPHQQRYRRILRDDGAYRLAVRDWRVAFSVGEQVLAVERIESGRRPDEDDGSELAATHRAFVERFGDASDTREG